MNNRKKTFLPGGSAAVLAAIVILALLIRGVYIYQIVPTPLARFLAADTGNFDEFARRILDGDLFHPESIYFNPLYPFLLAPAYRVFGPHPAGAMALQALLDAGICILLYALALRAFNSRGAGLTAALIYSAYGPAVFYTGMLLGTTAAAFLFTLTAFLLLPGGGEDGRGKLFLAGTVYGLCCLLRPNALFALPAIVLLLSAGPGRKARPLSRLLLRPLPLAAGLLLVILPFSLRHYRITGGISLPFGNGGFNFYVGNHPGAPGTYTYLEGISHSPAEQIKSSIHRAGGRADREIGLRQASGYWFGRAREFIRESPGEFISGLGRKFLVFWNRQEIGQNIDYQFSRRFSPLLRLPFISFGAIAPFAILGLFFSARRREIQALLPALLLFSYLASVVLFFVSDRYRLVTVPLIVLFAAGGLARLGNQLLNATRRTGKIPWASAGVLAGALIIVHLPLRIHDQARYQSWSHTMLGNVYAEDGRLFAALEEYRRALARNPGDPAALIQKGNALWKLGDLSAAAGLFRQVLDTTGPDVNAHNNLGAVLAEQGRFEEAFGEFSAALKLDPHAPEVHSNLAVYYLYFRGDPSRAAEHARRAAEQGHRLPGQLRQDLAIGE